MKLNFNITTVLSDGTPVSLTKYDVGGIISTVNSDGSTAIAPDGDYQFEDGSIATQTDGLITAIAPAPDADSTSPTQESDMSAPAPDAPTEDAPATDSDSTSDLSSQIQALTDAISQLQSTIESLTSGQDEMKKEIATVNDKFNKAVSKSILETGKVEKKTESEFEKRMNRLKTLNGFN